MRREGRGFVCHTCCPHPGFPILPIAVVAVANLLLYVLVAPLETIKPWQRPLPIFFSLVTYWPSRWSGLVYKRRRMDPAEHNSCLLSWEGRILDRSFSLSKKPRTTCVFYYASWKVSWYHLFAETNLNTSRQCQTVSVSIWNFAQSSLSLHFDGS